MPDIDRIDFEVSGEIHPKITFKAQAITFGEASALESSTVFAEIDDLRARVDALEDSLTEATETI